MFEKALQENINSRIYLVSISIFTVNFLQLHCGYLKHFRGEKGRNKILHSNYCQEAY
jgi:hypothetical protein